MYLFTKLMAPFSYIQYLIINLHIGAIAGRRLSNWKKTLKVYLKGTPKSLNLGVGI